MGQEFRDGGTVVTPSAAAETVELREQQRRDREAKQRHEADVERARALVAEADAAEAADMEKRAAMAPQWEEYRTLLRLPSPTDSDETRLKELAVELGDRDPKADRAKLVEAARLAETAADREAAGQEFVEARKALDDARKAEEEAEYNRPIRVAERRWAAAKDRCGKQQRAEADLTTMRETEPDLMGEPVPATRRRIEKA